MNDYYGYEYLGNNSGKRADTAKIDMNYISAVYGIVIFIVIVDWFVRGRREYRGASRRHEETSGLVRGLAEGSGEVKG